MQDGPSGQGFHDSSLLCRRAMRREADRLVTLPALRRGSFASYLAEFDFRYTRRSALGVNDNERAAAALKGIAGKRLTYRQANPKRLSRRRCAFCVGEARS